jgi:UDP-N-acetylglucosamine/UDP-N-acetylgalactosamine diphosphorylase
MGTDARALLEAPGVLATAPDGHGGAFEALARAGLLEEMRERGVDAICSFQVDNPLARPLDPVMLGWMVERRAQVVGKAVRKRSPDERVGVFARDLRGRHRIVEYTEIPDGGLPPDVDLGSIAVGAYGVAFLDDLWRQGLRLPLHRAKKKAPYLDRDGRRVEPAEPNAIKLERFVFERASTPRPASPSPDPPTCDRCVSSSTASSASRAALEDLRSRAQDDAWMWTLSTHRAEEQPEER